MGSRTVPPNHDRTIPTIASGVETDRKSSGIQNKPNISSAIELIMKEDERHWILKGRIQRFNFWMMGHPLDPNPSILYKKDNGKSEDEEINNDDDDNDYDSDHNNNNKGINHESYDGPWIDFIIGGHPKTGTTTIMANLGQVAPMPIEDICRPTPSEIMKLAFKSWPSKFNDHTIPIVSREVPPETTSSNGYIYVQHTQKPLRGTKCPSYMSNFGALRFIANKLPKTKLIIGIRYVCKRSGE